MIEKIGIVGGGQLGRMLTEAAHPLGFQVTVLDPTPNCPATQAGASQIEGGFKDSEAITELAAQTDVVTWELENIDAETLIELAEAGHDVQPSPATLRTIKDKYAQKLMLEKAGLPVASSVSLNIYGEAMPHDEVMWELTRTLGRAVILKARNGSYDGRGNLVFDGNIAEADKLFGSDWSDVYAEEIIPFERELAVIVARGTDGKVAAYPTVETVHKDNICHTVVCPAEIDPRIADEAQEVARETLKQLDGAGVFAIEMFDSCDGIIINEIAPRVHNSGHHTIEANVTPQFEQHIRAITGMPLGSTDMRVPAAAMINVLGSREEPLSREGLDRVLALPDTHPHFYGKSSKPARKIGHITVLGDTVEQVLQTAAQARKELVI